MFGVVSFQSFVIFAFAESSCSQSATIPFFPDFFFLSLPAPFLWFYPSFLYNPPLLSFDVYPFIRLAFIRFCYLDAFQEAHLFW